MDVLHAVNPVFQNKIDSKECPGQKHTSFGVAMTGQKSFLPMKFCLFCSEKDVSLSEGGLVSVSTLIVCNGL